MPRGCGCAGNACGCLIVAGPGLTISGTGNASDPYVVGSTGNVSAHFGPFSVVTTVDLTAQIDADAVIWLEIEHDVYFHLSDTAPIGTRCEVRTQQSFGAKIIPTGNIRTTPGVLLGVSPNKYYPVPPAGVAWISALKVSDLDWFIYYSIME